MTVERHRRSSILNKILILRQAMTLTICFYKCILILPKIQAQLFQKERANFVTLFDSATSVVGKIKTDMILLCCSPRWS
jgi:hypothetical protein